MGEIDLRLGHTQDERKSPKKTLQASTFVHLSPNVQKILANVPDHDITKPFASDEITNQKKLSNKSSYSKRTLLEKHQQKSSENLEIISPNVQKMLSNLPDTELVISSDEKKICKNISYLHHTIIAGESVKNKSFNGNESANGNNTSKSNSTSLNFNLSNSGASNLRTHERYNDWISNNSTSNASDIKLHSTCSDIECSSAPIDNNNCETDLSCERFASKPLGSYLHSATSGIASRTPVGRKNLGKYLQVRTTFVMKKAST